MIKKIKKTLCNLLGHKWHTPYGNSLYICKKCGEVDFKIVKNMEKQISIIVNDIEFIEIDYDEYIVYSEKNPFPFLNSIHNEVVNRWRFKSLILNGKFYAPKYHSYRANI